VLIALRSTVRSSIALIRRISGTMKAAATADITVKPSVPYSPNWPIRITVTSGPSAKPVEPATVYRDIEVLRRFSPTTRTAFVAPSGWNAAEPRPARIATTKICA